MALIECPECGNQISDKAAKCPHCGFVTKKKNLIDNHRKITMGTITITVVVLIALLTFKLHNNETKYPDIIGHIHLNMPQEDVEEILKSEISDDLFYSDLGKEDEVEIFICDSADGKKLSQMRYSKEHPSVESIKFTFDNKKKLKSIELLVMGNSYEAVEEFGLGCKYSEMETFYEVMWEKQYCVIGQTRIEMGKHDDYAGLGSCCSIAYKRVKDIEK